MDDFDVNSFKSKVINTIFENNEIIYLLDKDYIDCGGGLLFKRIFPYFARSPVITIAKAFCARS